MPETASLAEAVALLEAHHASCVIVARDDAPIGILTERDLVHLARQNLDLAATLLVNVMCAPVRSIAADYPLQDAIQQMEQAGIRRLAVLDGARLVGLVTRHDIVKTLQGRYIEYLQETINRQRLEMSRSQEQIHDVQQRLHTLSLMEQISDAIFVADAYTAELIEVNAQACRSLGYTREALLGMKAMDLESGITDLDSWQAFLDELTNNDAWTLDTHHRRSDGSLLPVQIKARRVHSNARDYVVCVARDVSRTRQLDAQLELQIHALNAAGNAIVITDTEPRILWANAAFSALTGYSLEEALGQKPAELVLLCQISRGTSGRHDDTISHCLLTVINNDPVKLTVPPLRVPLAGFLKRLVPISTVFLVFSSPAPATFRRPFAPTYAASSNPSAATCCA